MSLLKFYIRRRKVQVYQLSSDVWLYTFRSTANELFQYYSIFSYSRTFISKQDYWQLNLNLYNKTLSKQDIIKRKKEKSTIPSNELFARCQSSMLERTGERGREGGGERGWKKLQRRCGRWKAVKSREQKKPDRTAFEREGKNVYRAWATSYPALLFTGLPGAPELEVARFVSVPLPRRSIGNNYPVRNRRPPLIIPRSVDEKDFFLILLSLSPPPPPRRIRSSFREMGIMRLRWNRVANVAGLFPWPGLAPPPLPDSWQALLMRMNDEMARRGLLPARPAGRRVLDELALRKPPSALPLLPLLTCPSFFDHQPFPPLVAIFSPFEPPPLYLFFPPL